MKKLISLIALILICLSSQAKESTIRLNGRVRDKITQSSVMDAKVTIYDSKHNLIDSVRARSGSYDRIRDAYVQTSDFWMDIPKKKEIYTIEVAHEDYDTLYQTVDLTKLGARESDRNIGTFYLSKEQRHTLGEVSVTASKIKFFLKGDTIVYNADAFSLPEGSMLDALIEQMPGVEIRDGGEIYVNGRYVDALLLNGKDFFNKDKELMLNNIGAYTVKNVEVYDRQTDENVFKSNDSQHDKEYVMDVKLKKDYIGGWNFNIEGGYGSDDRYMGRFFGMHFTALKQLTLFANINNLNTNQRPNGRDTDIQPTMNSGLHKTKDVGFDYTIENAEATQKYTGNISVSIDDNLLEQSVLSTKILPAQNTYGQSLNRNDTHSLNLNSAFLFQWQTKSTFNKITPSFSHSYNRNDISSKTVNYLSEQNKEIMGSALEKWPGEEMSSSAKDDLLTAIFNESAGRYYNTKYGIDASTTIKVPHTSDNIGLAFVASRTETPSYNNSTYLINYGDRTILPTARKQYTRNKPIGKTSINATADYELQLNSSLKFSLYYKFIFDDDRNTSNFYLAKLASEYTGDYTIGNLRRLSMEYDPTNSYYYRQPLVQNSVFTCMQWKINKYASFDMYYHTHFVHRWLDYEKQTGNQHLSKSGVEFWQQTCFFYNRTSGDKRMYLSMINVLYRSMPPLMKMIDTDNTTDPLSIYLPNPNLKYSLTDDLNIYGSIYSPKFSVGFSGNLHFRNNEVVNGYIYNTATGVSTYKSYNVNGNYNYSLFMHASYSFNQNRRISLYLPYDRQVYHNMIGENVDMPQKSKVTSDSYRFRIGYYDMLGSCFNYSLNIEPSWRKSRSALQPQLNLNVNELKCGGWFMLKLPYRWQINTTIGLNHRSGYSESRMNGNEWIWNGNISKGFMNGDLVLSVFAYDLLKQIKSVSYSISADSRIETYSNTLPRYVLFRALYKINISPKKHKMNMPNTYRW